MGRKGGIIGPFDWRRRAATNHSDGADRPSIAKLKEIALKRQ
jgi:hypothetical protein